MLYSQGNRLIFRYDAEEVWIEPWGINAFRIRATKESQYPDTEEGWALQKVEAQLAEVKIEAGGASIAHGKVKATVSNHGKIMIFNSAGKLLLEEYVRNRVDVIDPKCSALCIEAREFKPNPGASYHLTLRFESLDKNEKIYGMGQYQQEYLDLKGLDLELAHRNSQASVPFALSSRGYGFLWNNPAIGRAVLGKNIMSFEAYSTKFLDYWVVAGDTPSEIVQAYASVTGTVPMMPEYGLGFWQCKLRYQTQEELLAVAREYKERQLPIDLIVIDFFHWPKQGDWRFDVNFWPDPEDMVRQLNEMGIKLMISIWPTVDKKSENFQEMLENGYLIRVDRGVRTGLDFEGETIHYDATNPKAREFLWKKAKENYYSKGIEVFWLDEAEPEYAIYDFDNYRYWRGSNLAIGNIYPVAYARTFYEGMEAEGQKNIVNLIRCAWAGSQKYGALVWSGDIASSWLSFRNQLAAGLNMGLAGLPWWTTDIGGFHGGDPNDHCFRELFVRWFQWGTFCPVMRLHGDREPRQPQVGEGGGASCCSGADNEVWSYGEHVYKICKTYMAVREEMRDYTRTLMEDAHKHGSPVMRPMFYDFPFDSECWNVETQYMYGHKYLCCPVLYPSQRRMSVYLPKGARWRLLNGELEHDGGKRIDVECPIEVMPVLIRI
ncbi:glycosyl hydrolases family 31-domain-containing protein [Bisporella sp. PMI_857]|nr:glycosyl hydrolases family 31-domain-containing protein [Bisporella sp. PMI_857]